LVARVRAVLRRSEPSTGEAESDELVRVGPLIVDPARREARLGDKLLELRSKEFDLLKALAEHQGMVLSRQQLLDLAWGFEYYGETRTVDVHVAQLRHHLGDDGPVTIETVWGVGYKLVANE
jgi:DNA-binding response OmpR family regulator